jgi:hypothetical protein
MTKAREVWRLKKRDFSDGDLLCSIIGYREQTADDFGRLINADDLCTTQQAL